MMMQLHADMQDHMKLVLQLIAFISRYYMGLASFLNIPDELGVSNHW